MKKMGFFVMFLFLLFSLTIGNLTAACVNRPNNLVAWWNGEGNAVDVMGGLNGTLQNGVTFSSGMVGQAFNFDGVDDYITIPDSSSMDLTTAFTIGAWIKVTSFNAEHATIIAKGDYTWRLQRSFSGNTMLFGTGDWTSGLWDDLSGNVNVNDGQWHYVTAVFDGGTKYLYVDGELDVSRSWPHAVPVRPDPVWIGNNANVTGRLWNGFIDEVEIYDRALSIGEIAAIYNAGIEGKCLPGHYNLSVNKTGTGSGAVSSEPTGISCGDTCSAQFVSATEVTLTATPDQGSVFAGWSGECDSNGRVTMDSSKSCTATFSPAQKNLVVKFGGLGGGTITSDPAGISCDGRKTNIALGKPVTALTNVVPGNGTPASTVDGLCIDPYDPDACPIHSYWYSYQTCGTSYNQFIIDLENAVPIMEVHFFPLQTYEYTIWTSDNNTDWTIRHAGTGPSPGYTSDITITVNGEYSARYINYQGVNVTCGYVGMGEFEVYTSEGCLASFDPGTVVTLTASPDSVSTFTGWSDGTGSAPACTGTGTCTFTISEDSTVTANFTRPIITPEEGTIGTPITITGPDFGMKKGKVLIGGLAVKIAKDGWQIDTISGTITKVPAAGVQDVVIKTKEMPEIPLVDAFTVKLPEITHLSSDSGIVGNPVTIYGDFFGTKKGKVYLEYTDKNNQLKKKNCKVSDWKMDSITFIVPKGLVSGMSYPLKVLNKVGEVAAPSNFIVYDAKK